MLSCSAVHLYHLIYLEDFLELWSKELNKEHLSIIYCSFVFSSLYILYLKLKQPVKEPNKEPTQSMKTLHERNKSEFG